MTCLRPARRDDAGALSALHAQSFARGWHAAEMEAFLADPAVIAVLAKAEPDDGSPLGFAMARHGGGEAELLTIAVLGPARRRGLGCLLLDNLMAELAKLGVTVLFLEVAEDNEAAKRLYLRAGFAQVARRPGYYKAHMPVDALVLRRNLGYN